MAPKFSFKRLFGKSNKKDGGMTQPSSSDKQQQHTTLERLREMEDLLRRKQSHLENRIQEEIGEARKHGMKNERAALNALKRKKRLETELTRLDGTLTTIELQREALESAKNNLQVLGAMKDAANVLKTAQKHVTVDKVLDIMDEVNEQQEVAKEIADAISNPLGAMSSSIDDDELEKELEELEQEDLNKALLSVNGVEKDVKAAEKADITEKKLNELDVLTDGPINLRPNDKIKVDQNDPDAKELEELAQWVN